VLSKGYIAVIEEELTRELVRDIADVWMTHFTLEQVCPGQQAGVMTLALEKPDDIVWEKNLQFRVTSGEAFTWIYLTLGKRVIESSGLPDSENTLPLEVFADIPAIQEAVSQENDKRLDQLEAEGLI
jgi:hypothetical protein